METVYIPDSFAHVLQTTNSNILLESTSLDSNFVTTNASAITMGENFTTGLDHCFYEPQQYLSVKIVMVGVFGTTLAALSLLENMLLFYMFCTRSRLRENHLYFAVLSVFDIFMSFSYIILMSMATFADWAPNLHLYLLWHAYLCPVFAFSHITMTSSTYLIIAATVERYCASIVHFRYVLQKMRANRQTVIAISIGLAVFFKGTVYFEIGVVESPECVQIDPFASLHATVTAMARNPIYDAVWRFWVRNITTIFVPFVLLAYCNAAIVFKLKQQTKKQTIKQLALSPFLERCRMQDTKSARRDVRSASLMMVMVVCCYLLANFLNVIITAWEHIDAETLLRDYGKFHTLGSDVASLLTVVASALRLPIYAINNPKIRHELATILRRVVQPRWKRRPNRDLLDSPNSENDMLTDAIKGNPVVGRRMADVWVSIVGDSATEQRLARARARLARTHPRHSCASYSSSEPSAFTPACTCSTGMYSSCSERDLNSPSAKEMVTVYLLHQAEDQNDPTHNSIDYVTWKQTANQ